MGNKIIKPEEIIKLSMKDKRIIKELNRDSRQSFSEIGKKVGLPKGVVSYRVKKLMDSGTISLFCTTINRAKLGYTYYRIFLKFRHFSEQVEKKLIDHVSKLNNIHWVASLDGSFDFCIAFLAKTMKEPYEIYKSIVHELDKYILKKELSIAPHMYYLQYNYLYEKKESGCKEVKPESEFVELDIKDYNLINLIKGNSRIPMLELMEKMDMSPQMIRNRIKNLVKNKVITGFNIRVDHTKFKLHHFHTFLKLTNMDEKIEKEFIDHLCLKKSTTHIIKGLGEWDLEFESVFQSHFELHNFLKELKNKFPENIIEYDSVLIYKIYPINTVAYG
jgi:Lrp/AsnC family transcriptional regulator, leucine-responsive regulatory protein